MTLVAIAEELREAVRPLAFSPPVRHVYNPLDYAWPAHRDYLERFRAACQRANRVGIRSYKGVHNILINKLDQRQVDPPSNTPLPPHENIRGENYYS